MMSVSPFYRDGHSGIPDLNTRNRRGGVPLEKHHYVDTWIVVEAKFLNVV